MYKYFMLVPTRPRAVGGDMGLGAGMMKVAVSKALISKINLAFLSFFFSAYVALLVLRPSTLYEEHPANIVRCSLRDCNMMKKAEEAVKRAAAETAPGFLESLHGRDVKIGLVNMGDEEVLDWGQMGTTTAVEFERVSDNFKWQDLFPEWIDEEEENEGPSCPEIPMPDFSLYGEMDVVVAQLPCRRQEGEGGGDWARDVLRLQVHLVVANLAVRKVRRSAQGGLRVVFRSACAPMMELFRCDDLVARQGDWWMYEALPERLQEKVALPVGSCKLALPLWGEGTNKEYDVSEMSSGLASPRGREAYATVLHSSDAYVCGAIALAQSIVKSGSTRDLVLLHDDFIAGDKLKGLVDAGWIPRRIERIRNPHAQKDSYNEYNYSKLRLWQLTDYSKVVFVDADILVLRNLDVLFRFPQISATGNDGVIFNSGVMVIEPSNCAFRALMARRYDIVSYNGGDQGFINEVFVWWHRLSRRVNFLKNFWSNTTAEATVKNQLFAADPPKLYTIHYLGLKPWMCYRDYDCNWNVGHQRAYASDAAHRTWWRLHDAMDHGLKPFCNLPPMRRECLDMDRQRARVEGFPDGHWRLEISDWRRSESMQRAH